MTFSRTILDGNIAYDPHFEVRRTCRNWDKINNWARERSVSRPPYFKLRESIDSLQLLNDPDLDLLIV
jgi:hypothetical protein